MKDLKELEKILEKLKENIEKLDINEEELNKEKVKGTLKARNLLIEHLKSHKPEALLYVDSEGRMVASGDGGDVLTFLTAIVSKFNEDIPEEMIYNAVKIGLEYEVE